MLSAQTQEMPWGVMIFAVRVTDDPPLARFPTCYLPSGILVTRSSLRESVILALSQFFSLPQNSLIQSVVIYPLLFLESGDLF